MSKSDPILVCFAVKEEAAVFERLLRPHVKVLLTGIGARNAEKALRQTLATAKPALILSCGFAGGLRTDLSSGTVVFDADPNGGLESGLLRAGAIRARFHCAKRVATTIEQKRALREQTGADAVEMESQIICAIAREYQIPSAIVRVILDTANEELPLDFNQLMNHQDKIDPGKLALAIAKAPNKIGGLIALRKQSKTAAEKLAQVLLALPPVGD